MYYRVAIQVDPSPLWQWKSSALSSLDALFHWLRLYRTLPQDHLRIFSGSSCEGLQEQLVQQNQGLDFLSVTAAHFLHERLIHAPEVTGGRPGGEGGADQQRASIAFATQSSVNGSSRQGNGLVGRSLSAQESRRLALELGPVGDHDIPYRFVLPALLPPVFAWMRLLARIQREELQP